MINERIHLRDLDDEDIADDVDNVEEPAAEDSDVEVLDGPPTTSKSGKKPQGPVLKTFRTDGISGAASSRGPSAATRATTSTAPSPAARTSTSSRRAQAADFMSAVSGAFDPATREARDETRFARRLAQNEIDRLTQENRDLRQRNESLSDRLQQQGLQLQQQVTETSRLQSRVDMLDMVRAMTGQSSGGQSAHFDEYRGRPRYDRWESPRTPRRYRSYSAVSPRTPRFYQDDHADLHSHSLHPPTSSQFPQSTLTHDEERTATASRTPSTSYASHTHASASHPLHTPGASHPPRAPGASHPPRAPSASHTSGTSLAPHSSHASGSVCGPSAHSGASISGQFAHHSSTALDTLASLASDDVQHHHSSTSSCNPSSPS